MIPSHVPAAITVVALVCLSAGCGAERTAEPGQIIYGHNTETGSRIMVIEPGGTGERPLTPLDAYGEPEWSADGTKIVFTNAIDCDPACSQICTMNADGTDRRCLTPKGERAEAPTWSPNGDEIAFVRWGRHPPGVVDIQTDIFVMRADGSGERQLTSTLWENGDPAWSPDGKTIVFFSDRDAPRDKPGYDLYAMRPDGSDVVRLTRTDAFEYTPDFSPDGELISFTRTGEGSDYFDIWVMNADGSDQHVLLRTPASEGEPAWSPDGRQVIFVSDETGSDEIYVMNADGGERNVLTHYDDGLGGTESPDWAPLREP